MDNISEPNRRTVLAIRSHRHSSLTRILAEAPAPGHNADCSAHGTDAAVDQERQNAAANNS